MDRLDKYHVARSEKRGTCEVYEVWFEPMGYAFFYIHEFPNGGTLAIVSDWGNYSHMWNSTGLPSLKHFLATCHSDYIVMKLGYEKGREFSHQFKSEKTLVNFKKRILEDRRDDRLSREEARDLWEILIDWSPDDNDQSWYWTMPKELSKQYPDPFEWGFEYGPSPRYQFLVDHLVPFFQRYLQRELGMEPKQENQETSHAETSV